MAFDILSTLIGLAVTIIVMAIFVVPSLWISGRLLAGKEKAKFTDAVWIVIIGTVVFYFFEMFIASLLISEWLTLLSYVVLLAIWLGLVKHFFDCGWLKALAISIISVIIFVIIMLIVFFVLALIGIGAGWLPVPAPLTNI